MSYYKLVEVDSDNETGRDEIDKSERKKCTLPRRLQSAIAGNNRSHSFILRRTDNNKSFPDESTNSFSLPSSPKGIKTLIKFPFVSFKARNNLCGESDERLENYFYEDRKVEHER